MTLRELTVCRNCLYSTEKHITACPRCGDNDRSFIVIEELYGPVLVRGKDIRP